MLESPERTLAGPPDCLILHSMTLSSASMRAAVFQDPATGISFEELTVDPPRPGEVEVRMIAAGVCHSDLHTRNGDWPLDRPTVLGHEGAAEVTSLGEGVTGLAPGDRVILSWNAPCSHCMNCVTGRPWLCVDNGAYENAMGDGTAGCIAHPARTSGPTAASACLRADDRPGERCHPRAARAPPAVAALIGCAVATGVGAAVNTARVEPGSSVVVVGCGGVGLSVVMGAALAGATPIIAVDSNPAKLELARDLGATHAVLGRHGSARDRGDRPRQVRTTCSRRSGHRRR